MCKKFRELTPVDRTATETVDGESARPFEPALVDIDYSRDPEKYPDILWGKWLLVANSHEPIDSRSGVVRRHFVEEVPETDVVAIELARAAIDDGATRHLDPLERIVFPELGDVHMAAAWLVSHSTAQQDW